MDHALFGLGFLVLSEPHHRHLQLDHEQLNLALLDELPQCLQKPILPELLAAEGHALGGQVADGPVEHLQSEELLDQGVVLQEGGLEHGGHVVFVDESALTGEVLVDDSEDGQDIPASGAALEEFVVDSEDGQEEFPGEGEVELGVFADELSDQGKDVEHAEFEVLVWRVFLPM